MNWNGTILGVDFTSAPRRAKAITVASGDVHGDLLVIDTLERIESFGAFEALLERPGPWLGGFDFPFGMPRELVRDLGWPDTWAEMVRHCAHHSREEFRGILDAYRAIRPPGNRYAHRATDIPAGSSSPMKLVNPPVALMFLEGAPRLLRANVTVPGMHQGDPQRIALEGYPGLLARRITRASYKSDTRSQQTEARRAARMQIMTALERGIDGLRLDLRQPVSREMLVEDGTGDLLDSVLCALQAGLSGTSRMPPFGIPDSFDPIEGWILGAQPARR
jgi:hypothetical protein